MNRNPNKSEVFVRAYEIVLHLLYDGFSDIILLSMLCRHRFHRFSQVALISPYKSSISAVEAAITKQNRGQFGPKTLRKE